MNLTRRARQHYPHNRRLAAKLVIALRYIKARGIQIKPWYGVVKDGQS